MRVHVRASSDDLTYSFDRYPPVRAAEYAQGGIQWT
jgi:hypothetical protein